MPISPIAFSDSAKALLSVGGEIDYRNAASRAYYCMYHSIQRKVLSQCKNIPLYPKAGVHAALIRFLEDGGKKGGIGSIDAKECLKLSMALGAAKRLRARADYDLDDVFSRTDAEQVIRSAERFV